jgi:hypothetical protein
MRWIAVIALCAGCGGADSEPAPGDTGTPASTPTPTTPATPTTDLDGDGFDAPADCDDGDASVNPGTPDDMGDGIDENCDGVDGTDDDGDGVPVPLDCDDTEVRVRPDAEDTVGDDIDEDCDGVDGVDGDGDGYASVESGGTDCDDAAPAISPADVDGDGSSVCDGDCDDADPLRSPDVVELCNGLDDDCDLQIDFDALGTDACSRDVHLTAGMAVDLLIVVDNSCSMSDPQLELALGVDELLAPLVGVAALQVGVVTTDMADPQQSGLLHETNGVLYLDPTYDLDDAVAWTGAAVLRGIGGSPIGKGFDAVFTAIDTYGFTSNAGFYRPSADLAILFLSDDDDASLISPLPAFENWLAALKAPPAIPIVNAIVSDGSPFCPTHEGLDYASAAAAFGGGDYLICQDDLAPDLAAIGQSLVPPPFDGILTLPDVPDPATLSVTVTEVEGAVVTPVEGVDWDFDAALNAIQFNGIGYWPPQGSDVEITYQAVP